MFGINNNDPDRFQVSCMKHTTQENIKLITMKTELIVLPVE